MAEEALTFDMAFARVMEREMGCTPERSVAILKSVRQEIIDFYRLESRILRGIKLVLNNAKVYDDHGGIGNDSFVMYFKGSESHRRGVVPARYFKATDLSDSQIRHLLVSWADLWLEPCAKCNTHSPVIDVESNASDSDYKCELIFCEKCDKVFVKDMLDNEVK